MRLILIFLLLLSFNLKGQVISLTNCDSLDRVQTFYVDLHTGSTYEWSVNGATILNTNENKVTILCPSLESSFTISVIERNANRCPGDSRKLLVEITPCQDEVIWIPSAFTPNGDNRNDIFRVMGNITSKEFSLQIYNRWGELIFESNDVEIGWDGTYKGTLVQDDIYTYRVFCLVNSRYYLKYGSVTLIR